ILLLVCFDRRSSTGQAVTDAGKFVVNLLSADQVDLSNHFASSEHNADFDRWPYTLSEGGIPILDGGIGHLECTVAQEFDGGDHAIVIGEVHACSAREGAPLLYFRGRYREMAEPETENQ
ncbi:MAG: flavin reductase, partial [Myxococcales bacterium]|nr:flavin reductase [Myxococcales bacterium]